MIISLTIIILLAYTLLSTFYFLLFTTSLGGGGGEKTVCSDLYLSLSSFILSLCSSPLGPASWKIAMIPKRCYDSCSHFSFPSSHQLYYRGSKFIAKNEFLDFSWIPDLKRRFLLVNFCLERKLLAWFPPNLQKSNLIYYSYDIGFGFLERFGWTR